MKRIKNTAALILTIMFVSVFTACTTYSYIPAESQPHYVNPNWAPAYYQGVRYYYLPDIETYYDLSSQEFVFLNNGQWTYSAYLPAMYSGFDLNNCFTIELNTNIYQPWMHHQYYVSHYPRYYYRDYYDHSNIPYVRGYNENIRSAVYWPENERTKVRDWDNSNVNSNKQFKYSNSDKEHQNKYSNYNNGKNQNSNSKWNNGNYNNENNNKKNDYNQNKGNSGSGNQQHNTGNSTTVTKPNGNYNGNNTSTNENNRDQRPTGNNTVNNKPATGNSTGTNNRPTTGNTTVTNDRPSTGNTTQPKSDNNTGVTAPRTQNNNNVTRQQTTEPTGTSRTTQGTNYYGRTIGQPVKVERQMKEGTDVRVKQTTTTTEKPATNNGTRR